MSLDASADIDVTQYAFKMSPVGAPSEFSLHESEMEWRNGARALRVPYGDVRRMRLLYRPVTLQNFRFATEIKTRTGAKITIASTSWRSMIEHERHDSHYRGFIAELHRRIAASGATVIYRTGAPALLYWPGLLIAVGLLLATAALVIRALQLGEWQGAAFIGLMLAFFLWQTLAFFRRNRPGVYAPDRLPEQVLP